MDQEVKFPDGQVTEPPSILIDERITRDSKEDLLTRRR
jgi:hypothetical protein